MNFTRTKRNAIIVMLVLDYITAALAWLVFWFYRQDSLHAIDPGQYPQSNGFTIRDYLITFLAIPIYWVVLYYLSGTYFDLYRKSRLHEIYRSIASSMIGALAIGMIFFANDTNSFSYFFEVTSWYFIMHFALLLIFRLLWLYKIKQDLIHERVGYQTLIVGGNSKAKEVYLEIQNNPIVLGNLIAGFINIDPVNCPIEIPNVQLLGPLEDLEKIIDQYNIEEVIVAMESHEHQLLESIVMRLSYRPVIVKVLPDLYDIISGFVRISNVYAPVLISINPELLPDWQKVCKRAMDVLFSLFAIILLIPVYIFSALKVKLSSRGPIFYKQERIGLFGRPFYIYKFRSMYTDAEEHGPLLSTNDDPRITKWGKIMRKWRIDELPQFFNILNGDMALVGPRPERQFYINKITQTHPHYKYLHRVKPGITSWGMVQFGYAENIEEMIKRMKYDLLYIENCSLALDIKIMIYTVKVILQGRGK